jgi:hypothetical protein
LAEKDYSGTPLWKKLGLREGSQFALIGAPRAVSIDVPAGVRSRSGFPAATTDVIVLFATRLSELSRSLARAKSKLDPAGGLWIAYPKKSSKLATDLTFEDVQRAELDLGLVDNKSCAIDEDWSGLRFVYRLADRPKATSATREQPGRGRAKRP